MTPSFLKIQSLWNKESKIDLDIHWKRQVMFYLIETNKGALIAGNKING